jgi:hypothetical protein
MPNISVLKTSNFIKKEDCDPPALVTIDRVAEENVAKEGAPHEMKWCIYFKEIDKPMVLNSTNGQIIAQITGSQETDDWAGKKIVIYHDPSVSFGGKLVGGIRCRAPRGPANPAKPTTQPALPVEDEGSDTPF